MICDHGGLPSPAVVSPKRIKGDGFSAAADPPRVPSSPARESLESIFQFSAKLYDRHLPREEKRARTPRETFVHKSENYDLGAPSTPPALPAPLAACVSPSPIGKQQQQQQQYQGGHMPANA